MIGIAPNNEVVTRILESLAADAGVVRAGAHDFVNSHAGVGISDAPTNISALRLC
jgi:hypothetical protein